jgi:RasGEF domain
VKHQSGADKFVYQVRQLAKVPRVILSPVEAPPVVKPTLGWEHAALVEVHSDEFARQITLLNSVSYSRLQSSEFLHKAWSHSTLRQRCPQIISLIDSFNDLTGLCSWKRLLLHVVCGVFGDCVYTCVCYAM